MNEFATIKSKVCAAGLELLSEELHPDDFGSALALFRGKNDRNFRLVWDGKDGCGFLQVQLESGGWENRPPFVSECFSENSQALKELLAAARRLGGLAGS